LQQQTGTLQASLTDEKATVGELETKVASLDEAGASLTTERDEAVQSAMQVEQANVSELTASVASLKESNSALTGERDTALGDIAMLQQKLDSAGGEISSLSGQRDTLQQQIDDAAAQEQGIRDATLTVRSEIDQKLVTAGVTSASVSAIDDDRAVAITLGSGDLYRVGSASLSREGNALLADVGAVVAEYPDWHVDVVGHTDAQGIGAELRKRYPTNWELSTARASAAVRFLAAKSGVDADKLSARGQGDTMPLASNETAQGREQNRRVDIILRR